MVTVSDGQVSGTAPLSADGTSFIVPVEPTPTPDRICRIEILYSGTISGDNIRGTISGRSPLNVDGFNATIVWSGNFSATRTSTSRAPAGSGVKEAIENLLDELQDRN